MEIICFFAGVVFVCLKTAYPPILIVLALIVRARYQFFLWFVAGIIWALFHQWWIAADTTLLGDVIPSAKLQGYIVSMPNRSMQKIQFQFLADHLDGKSIRMNLLLSCYDHCPLFQAGQHWQMTAKLKKPINFANPGGFDYVRGLNARHIDRTGYIRRGSCKLLRAKNNHYFLLSLRENLAETLGFMIHDEQTLGILQALTLGITSYISKNEWDLFRRTGTTHLMVISGAHIGLVAGLVYAIVKWLWCRLGSFCLLIPAQRVASVMALLMASVYALLAGLGVPAQRALIVCFFMFLRHFCNQSFSAWQAWRYALLAVLITEPHSVMLPGFYLSFLAVAILVSVNQRLSFTGFRKTISLQIACAFGLMPLTLFWFSYGSINGLAANLLAIPWVSFVIVPLGLVLLLFGTGWMIPGFVSFMHFSITSLLTYLHWIDSFACINLELTFDQIFTPMMLIIIMTMMVFMPIKRLFPAVIVLAIAGSTPAHEKINEGAARINILDVGQGLAIAVHTASHVLIYDTGLKYYQGTDMGKMVIIPYLEAQGVKYIDKVVISHPDLDHRGGLLSLETKFKISELLVDDPNFYHRGKSCHHYKAWTWDGVSFRFFPIDLPLLKSKNNTSCVLQVITQAGQILLTGDIEKQAEKYLVDTYGKELASSVIVIPHHGSKTSSTPAFIDEVAPQYAVVSYGIDNHYHFPHQPAMKVYEERGIPVYNTAHCGMLSVLLEKNINFPHPSCYNDVSATWLDKLNRFKFIDKHKFIH